MVSVGFGTLFQFTRVYDPLERVRKIKAKCQSNGLRCGQTKQQRSIRANGPASRPIESLPHPQCGASPGGIWCQIWWRITTRRRVFGAKSGRDCLGRVRMFLFKGSQIRKAKPCSKQPAKSCPIPLQKKESSGHSCMPITYPHPKTDYHEILHRKTGSPKASSVSDRPPVLQKRMAERSSWREKSCNVGFQLERFMLKLCLIWM